MPTTKRDQMGAVHVRVRLSNASDVVSVAKGLLEPQKVRSCEVDALVDTGATESIVPRNILEQLGLSIVRETFGILADGSKVPMGYSSPISFDIYERQAFQGAYVVGDEVLIGQTLLEAMDLLVDCKNQRVIPGHPEGQVVRL